MNQNGEDNLKTKMTVMLLAYYFEPCTYVAANRPNSFAKELAKYGFDVVVVTRQWSGKEMVWGDYLEGVNQEVKIDVKGHLTVHRLPYQPTTYLRNKFFSKCQAFFRIALGHINHDVNYYQYKQYISSLLSTKKVDFILVSIPPINALRLASELSKKHMIKLVIDVRDYENRIVLNKDLQISFPETLRHKLTTAHSMKWFKRASLIFTVNQPITNFIRSHTKNSVLTVMNGYPETLLNVKEAEYSEFHITLIGSLYEIPEFSELLKGLKVLFSMEFSRRIKVQFIGSNTSESIVRKLRDAIPSDNLILRDRMPQLLAQKEAARSHLLLVLGFKNMKAVLGTKPFEYMGLRKTILQMPGDQDLMQEIILACNAGFCPTNAEQFAEIIKNCYFEWKNSGTLKYHGNIDLIKQYSREEQFKQLLPYFN